MLRQNWRLGRVVKLYQAADGVVRQVNVKTAHGYLLFLSWPYWMIQLILKQTSKN